MRPRGVVGWLNVAVAALIGATIVSHLVASLISQPPTGAARPADRVRVVTPKQPTRPAAERRTVRTETPASRPAGGPTILLGPDGQPFLD
jgi:hypothetical protein